MKIFTEETVREMLQHHIEFDHLYPDADTIFEDYPPIELPTDEEIEASKHPENSPEQELYNDGWEDGIKWLRNKIQGGNK